MAAALDGLQLPDAGVVALALLAGLLLFRGVALAARAAVWLSERIHGPEELYADRAAPGATVGHQGTARTDLAPRGKVFVRGELWEAEAESPVSAGQPVEILSVDGLVLRVRAATDDRRA